MIPNAIRAALGWWAKYPWPVFVTLTIFGFPFVFIVFTLLLPSFLPRNLAAVVIYTSWLSWAVVWFGSLLYVMLIYWKRSILQGVFASVLSVVVVGLVILIVILIIAPKRIRNYDALVKSRLMKAALAEEAYFANHHTYTNKIGSLMEYGYDQSDSVIITMEATTTTYVINGTMTKACKAKTGTWSYNGIDGSISGTPCSR